MERFKAELDIYYDEAGRETYAWANVYDGDLLIGSKKWEDTKTIHLIPLAKVFIMSRIAARTGVSSRPQNGRSDDAQLPLF